MRIYSEDLGRFLSVDPLTVLYPWYTPYQFAGNSPIKFIDLDGGEPKEPEKPGTNEGQTETTRETKFVASPGARGGTWNTTTTTWNWHAGGIESTDGSKSKAGWYTSENYANVLTPVAKELAIEAGMTNGASNMQLSGFKAGELANFVGNGVSENTMNHLAGQAQNLANKANGNVIGFTHPSTFNIDDMICVGLLFKEGLKLLTGIVAKNIAAKPVANWVRSEFENYLITSRSYLKGGTYNIEIFGLWHGNEKGTLKEFASLLQSFETQATKSGATKIKITGIAIEHQKII